MACKRLLRYRSMTSVRVQSSVSRRLREGKNRETDRSYLPAAAAAVAGPQSARCTPTTPGAPMFDFGLMINSGARKPATDGQRYGMFGETVEQAVWAEEHGFQGAWVGEGRLASSAVIPMTLIAAATKRIKVGSGIVPYRTRNVGLLAVTFKTL